MNVLKRLGHKQTVIAAADGIDIQTLKKEDLTLILERIS